MRLRRRSIRAKITALLLVPLTALTGLWAYTSVVSATQVWGLFKVVDNYRWYGNPADDLSRALQDERRAAVAFAATKVRGTAVPTTLLAPLRAAEQRTDAAAQVFGEHANDGGHRGDLSDAQATALRAIQDQVAALRVERTAVEQHYLDWFSVYVWYTNVQDPFFTLRLELSDIPAGDLARTAQNLVEIVRAREYISREDALEEGAHLQAPLSDQQFQELLSTAATEQLLFRVHTAQLPQPLQGMYQDFQDGSDYSELNSLENYSGALGAAQHENRLNYPQWRETADRVLDSLSALDQQAATTAGEQGRSYAMQVIWRDGIAGLIGLLAVIATIVISLRIGRRLVRELVGLRDGAFELAGVRLPSVMRRLRDGEKVDVAVEAPPLTAPDESGGRPTAPDELAQLGRAFNAVQRAAIEAAVEQAELRRGVAAVFVNLARRSQALLHRQLSLLDEMERRAEDPEELEDLFRLDHLTTRMRRHAEGLIILSGAAPGRSWRRPVRVLDVVRAGVGEIEDYARVRVHRMPPVAVAGGAVSDLVHLIAELVENATVFSPPHTQVRIVGEEVAHGFVLEVDDRGLGMGDEALAAANDRLATGGDFDLGDTDRLGLFVVSRLAARHQIRVSLRRSPYGGTTAVVLLPHELLTAAAPRPGDAEGAGSVARTAAGDAAGTGSGEYALPPSLTRGLRDTPAETGRATSGRLASATRAYPGRLGGPRPHTPDESAGTGGLPRRRPKAALSVRQEVLSEELLAEEVLTDEVLSAELLGAPTEGRTDADVIDAEVLSEEDLAVELLPAVDDAIGSMTAAGIVPPGGAPALPRRVRQANLAPQLRRTDAAPPQPPAARPGSAGDRTPEQARATFGAFQRGLVRGRSEQRPPTPEDQLPANANTEPTAEGTTR
ncbi:sensor histidine kinase [Streptacidiphilus jiangxiensis]|uniref:histidine kinase n=1 Tax=Streptacidiphilus jiangxiensis TaxID=235985 RepID=A0A1H7X2I0_STRJI|nr:sensor histidine kinase [Streptacidiphilus jiangxiensis]SEM27795.1 Signal transduction histidine kinase [Streptacidiphilus jiangxiensis]